MSMGFILPDTFVFVFLFIFYLDPETVYCEILNLLARKTIIPSERFDIRET